MISADLHGLNFNLDFDFYDFFRICVISVLVAF